MPRFNFNEITKSGKADIDLIGQNFEEIEANGITEAEVDAKVGQDNFKYIYTEATTTTYGKEIYIIRRGKIVNIHGKLIKYNDASAQNKETSRSLILLKMNEQQNWFKPSNNYKKSGEVNQIPLAYGVDADKIPSTYSMDAYSSIFIYAVMLSSEATAEQEALSNWFRFDFRPTGIPEKNDYYTFNFSFSYAVD